MPFLSIPWRILFYKLLGNKTRLNQVFAVVGRTKQSFEIPVVQDEQAGSVNALFVGIGTLSAIVQRSGTEPMCKSEPWPRLGSG